MSTAVDVINNKGPFRWSIAWAMILIALGLVGIALPLETSLAIIVLVGWLLIFSGAAQCVYAFHSRAEGSIVWKLLVALLYFGVGIYFLAHPLRGLTSLTLLIGYFFLMEGVMDLVTYFKYRKSGEAGWIMFGALVKLILGTTIWAHWLSGSSRILGTLIGINIFMTGLTRLMLSRSGLHRYAVPADPLRERLLTWFGLETWLPPRYSRRR